VEEEVGTTFWGGGRRRRSPAEESSKKERRGAEKGAAKPISSPKRERERLLKRTKERGLRVIHQIQVRPISRGQSSEWVREGAIQIALLKGYDVIYSFRLSL
jgi:hypothetical protein